MLNSRMHPILLFFRYAEYTGRGVHAFLPFLSTQDGPACALGSRSMQSHYQTTSDHIDDDSDGGVGLCRHFAPHNMGAPMLELTAFNMMCTSARRQLLIAVYRWRWWWMWGTRVVRSAPGLQRPGYVSMRCILCTSARDASCMLLARPTARQNAIVNACFIELLCIISVVVLGHLMCYVGNVSEWRSAQFIAKYVVLCGALHAAGACISGHC